MIKQIDRETGMCMSLASRPGNFGCRFFNFLFGELGINFVYRSIAPRDLADALRGMRALKIHGSALSMPYKEQAIPLLDEVDAAAAEIGAVNTVLNRDGSLKGFNTDYLGVRKCLSDRNVDPSSATILLGSGGMARAIAFALHDLAFTNVTVVARNAETRGTVARKFNFGESDDLRNLQGAVLINATPIGMAPDDPSVMSFPSEMIESSKAIVESVSDPAETGLVKTGRQFDKILITGFDIILNQAIEQFKIYFGQDLQPELVARAAAHARA